MIIEFCFRIPKCIPIIFGSHKGGIQTTYRILQFSSLLFPSTLFYEEASLECNDEALWNYIRMDNLFWTIFIIFLSYWIKKFAFHNLLPRLLLDLHRIWLVSSVEKFNEVVCHEINSFLLQVLFEKYIYIIHAQIWPFKPLSLGFESYKCKEVV